MSRRIRSQVVWLAVLPLTGALAHAEPPPQRIPIPILKQLGSSFLRHGGPVTSVVVAPDGRHLFSAAEDGSIRRWNLVNSREDARFTGSGPVRCLELTPDGKRLLAGHGDGTVCMYDAQVTTKSEQAADVPPLRTYRLRNAAVEAIHAGPQAHRFLVGFEDGSWQQQETESERVTAAGQIGESVRKVVSLRDGKHLVTPREEGGLILWSLDGPSKKQEVRGETCRTLVASPDGTCLAMGDFAGELTLYRLPTLEVLWKKKVVHDRGRDRGVTALAFAPDGQSLVTAGTAGVIRHWGVKDGTDLGRFFGHRMAVRSLAFTPDGSELISGGEEGFLQRWVVARHEPLGRRLVLEDMARQVVPLPEGNQLAVLVGGRVRFHAPDTLAPLAGSQRAQDLVEVRSMHWISSEEAIVHLHSGALERVTWQPDLRRTELLSARMRCSHFAVQGRQIAGLTEDRKLLLMNGDRPGDAPRELDLNGDLGTAVAFSPDGTYLAAVATSTVVRVWESATGKPVRELSLGLGGGQALAFTPDTRLLLVAGRDSLVRMVELETGTVRQELAIPSGYPVSMALTRDGRFLAVGTRSGALALFDRVRGVLLDQIEGHRGAVLSLAFVPGTYRLLSVGSEGILYLRDGDRLFQANRPQPLQLTPRQLEEAWDQLGMQDAQTVGLALQTLHRAEAGTIDLLRARLKPVDGARVRNLLNDLGADDFEVRDRALRELGRMGKAVEPTLKANRELPGSSLDLRVRIEELLDRIVQNRSTSDYLQSLRGIELLERLGTPAARELLNELAKGLPEAEITIQAQASLRRLQKP